MTRIPWDRLIRIDHLSVSEEAEVEEVGVEEGDAQHHTMAILPPNQKHTPPKSRLEEEDVVVAVEDGVVMRGLVVDTEEEVEAVVVRNNREMRVILVATKPSITPRSSRLDRMKSDGPL